MLIRTKIFLLAPICNRCRLLYGHGSQIRASGEMIIKVFLCVLCDTFVSFVVKKIII